MLSCICGTISQSQFLNGEWNPTLSSDELMSQTVTLQLKDKNKIENSWNFFAVLMVYASELNNAAWDKIPSIF